MTSDFDKFIMSIQIINHQVNLSFNIYIMDIIRKFDS